MTDQEAFDAINEAGLHGVASWLLGRLGPAGFSSEPCCGARLRAEWQGDHTSPHGLRVAETKEGGGIDHSDIIQAAALTYRVARELFWNVDHPKKARLIEAAGLLAELSATALRSESGSPLTQSERTEGEGCRRFLPFGWDCQQDGSLRDGPCDACPTPGAGGERAGLRNEKHLAAGPEASE